MNPLTLRATLDLLQGLPVIDDILRVIQDAVKAVAGIVIAAARIIYPAMFIIGLLLYATQADRYKGTRLMMAAAVTGAVVELILPAIGWA